MADYLLPRDKNELILCLEGVLRSIPIDNIGMRKECRKLIDQLKAAKNVPTEEDVFEKESGIFIKGNDKTESVLDHFNVTLDEVAANRPRSTRKK